MPLAGPGTVGVSDAFLPSALGVIVRFSKPFISVWRRTSQGEGDHVLECAEVA